MRYLAVIACLLLAIASGCASPTSRFYTLSAPSPTGGKASGPSVAVGPVALPTVVDRPQIVVQTGANEVRLDEFNRWASPLPEDITRVIAANLAQELATERVWPYGQSTQTTTDYQVRIDIQKFESTLGNGVVIEALWTVRRVADDTSRSGRSLVREATVGGDFDALVAAHSRALARVSGEIAVAIRAP
jgi:uncharacterized lipoprotein YmbA